MSLGAAAMAALDDLVDVLKTAKVAASANVGQVQVPGAWVTPRTITPLTLDGGAVLRCHVYLIVAESDATDSVKGLGKLLDLALAVVDPDEPIDTAQAVALPDTPPLPAYRLTVDIDLTP